MSRLSAREVRLLSRTQREILTFAHVDNPNLWMRTVLDALKHLLDCDVATFMIATPDPPYYSTDLSASGWHAYLEDFATTDIALPMLEGLGKSHATTEDARRSPLWSAYESSAAYNEWYVPNGMTSAISLRTYGAPVGRDQAFGPRWKPTLLGNILLGRGRPGDEKWAAYASAVLDIIQPAFDVAVQSVFERIVGSGGEAERLLRPIFAVMDRPFWIFDRGAKLLHESDAASNLAGRLSESHSLVAAATELARSVLSSIADEPVVAHRVVFVGGERLSLLAAFVGDLHDDDRMIIVRAEGVLPLLPTEEVIREIRGCTAQEAKIALLLARGDSPATISQKLSISIHTVRRHTEGVLSKLGIKRTAEIGPVLLEIRVEDSFNHARRPR